LVLVTIISNLRLNIEGGRAVRRRPGNPCWLEFGFDGERQLLGPRAQDLHGVLAVVAADRELLDRALRARPGEFAVEPQVLEPVGTGVVAGRGVDDARDPRPVAGGQAQRARFGAAVFLAWTRAEIGAVMGVLASEADYQAQRLSEWEAANDNEGL
jgi:hypothetical protein